MHSYLTAHCAFARDRSRIVRSPFAGRFPFSASPLRSRLANASGRIEFIIVLFMDWSFASGCSPPRLSTTQLPSATDRPVLLSDRDFHPTVGAYFQAHLPNGCFAPTRPIATWSQGLPANNMFLHFNCWRATLDRKASKVSYRLQLIGWCSHKLSLTVLFDNHSKRRWPSGQAAAHRPHATGIG
jgi:hypothetical protein